MAEYLAMRIAGGYLDYTAVITKYPELKPQIDQHLTDMGRGDLIVP